MVMVEEMWVVSRQNYILGVYIEMLSDARLHNNMPLYVRVFIQDMNET